MIGKESKLLPLCMLLLLAAGVLMPYAASSIQDRKLAAQTESRPLNDIEFTLREGSGVEQTLELLSGGYTQIMLQEGKNLTQQEAEEAAGEVVDLLIQEELLPDFTPESTGSSFVFAAIPQNNQSSSAVIWVYSFRGKDQSHCSVWIDDASGKLVSVYFTASTRTSTYMTPTVESGMESQIGNWSIFLQDYYGLELVGVAQASGDETGNVFTLELIWEEDGRSVSCKLPMLLRDDDVFFCW